MLVAHMACVLLFARIPTMVYSLRSSARAGVLLLFHLLAGSRELYAYTADLLTLDLCRCPALTACSRLSRVQTPLVCQAWEAVLVGHPDRAFARYVTRGIREGFRIGFHRSRPLRSAARNMLSACMHPEVIQAYLDKECAAGRMLGPFSPPALGGLPPLHVNRFGVIPKGHNTGKWRLITDQSYPPGLSVNDGIDPELCSLTYTSVDAVAEVVASYPPGALLAKVDVESAYRLIPVHPSDRPLQAMEWEGAVYVDPMLPFGLRSAPKIFNAVADGLEWYLRSSGIRHIAHYLDDFIVIGQPRSSECADALATLDGVCSRLGIPLAQHKRDGPTTCLTFLGIEVDTEAAELRLPQDKLGIPSDPFSRTGAIGKCAGGESSNPWWGYSTTLAKWYAQVGPSCAACWTSSKGITTPYAPTDQAEQVVPLRPDLVEAVWRRMERSLLPAPLL